MSMPNGRKGPNKHEDALAQEYNAMSLGDRGDAFDPSQYEPVRANNNEQMHGGMAMPDGMYMNAMAYQKAFFAANGLQMPDDSSAAGGIPPFAYMNPANFYQMNMARNAQGQGMPMPYFNGPANMFQIPGQFWPADQAMTLAGQQGQAQAAGPWQSASPQITTQAQQGQGTNPNTNSGDRGRHSHSSSGMSSPLFSALNNEYEEEQYPAFTPVDPVTPPTLSGAQLPDQVLGMLGLTPEMAAQGYQQPMPDIALPEPKLNVPQTQTQQRGQQSGQTHTRSGGRGQHHQRRSERELDAQQQQQMYMPMPLPEMPGFGLMPQMPMHMMPNGQPAMFDGAGMPTDPESWQAQAQMMPMLPALLPYIYNQMYAAHMLAQMHGGMPMMPMAPEQATGQGQGRNGRRGRRPDHHGSSGTNSGDNTLADKSKPSKKVQDSAQPSAAAPRRSQSTYTFADGVLTVVEKEGATAEYTTLVGLEGKLCSLCKDQHGCRFVQRQLDEDSATNFPIIFAELVEELSDLMSDPFGNYMVQKLIEVATGDARRLILDRLCFDAVATACNMHGTRTIQKAVECLKTPAEVAQFTDALKENLVAMVKDVNANHVIQKCLATLEPADKQFIFDAISEQCVDIATHRHGCCVMQRCFDHGSVEQKSQLVTRVVQSTLGLVQDPFGNYVVQYILDMKYADDITRIARSIKGHVADLSTQKFSSNVMEKILQVCDPAPRSEIIRELMLSDAWFSLLQDPYGNYVIQTALQTATPVDRAGLIEAIKPYLPAIRNTPYGKRIQSKIAASAPDAQQH